MRRIGIVGSRNFRDLDKVKEYVESLDRETIVVSGGVKGFDETVGMLGEELGMKVVSFKPDLKILGRRSDIETCTYSDMICAFWDGKSKGTKNTIDTAKKMNTIVQVFSEE